MATVFFLAPTKSGATLMAKYFSTYAQTTLTAIMGAYTEDNNYMISCEVDEETYLTYALNAMQSLDKIIKHHFSFRVVDKDFHMYRITMM